MESKKTRHSYTSVKKLEIVQYAEIHGNRQAGKVYNVNEASIREWRKKKRILETMKPNTRARRGRKAHWPVLESELKAWVLDLRHSGRRVSTTSIKLKAISIAKQQNIEDFKGSDQWCNRFMHRNQLSVRAVTSVGQNLPINWQETVELFKLFISEKIVGVERNQIGNMDEVPMSFDMPSNFTVESKGTGDVKIITTGAEKCNFTVVLSVTCDGGKLQPMVIFKRKTIPKEKFPPGIFVQANEKGWMNEEYFAIWLENIWSKRRDSFFKPKSVLIIDSAPSHLTPMSKINAAKHSQIAVIPGGLTKKLQPLDISVNKSFKGHIRNKWEKWMIEGYHTFTNGGKMRKASFSEVCEWIVEAWSLVTTSCVKNGFYKAKIVCDDEEIIGNSSDFEWTEEEDINFINLEDPLPDSFLDLLNSLDIQPAENCD